MPRIPASVLACLFVFTFNAFAADRDFSTVDEKVRALPKAATIAEAAELIAKAAGKGSASGDGAGGEWALVRGIYVWLSENIAYDADAFFRGSRAIVDPEGVFRTGKSVCQGYSALMAELGGRLGLEVVAIPGYAKGYGYQGGQRFAAPNHAWNAVRVDGAWRLFDPTWGAGHVDGRSFVKRYSELWFDTPPELFLLHHFPQDGRWKLASGAASLSDFEATAYVDHYSLESLRALGFPDAAILKGAVSGDLPRSWAYPGYAVKVRSAPLRASLAAGEKHTVELESSDIKKAYAVSGGSWTELAREGRTFRGSFTAARGEVWIAGFLSFQGKESYWPFLIYEGK